MKIKIVETLLKIALFVTFCIQTFFIGLNAIFPAETFTRFEQRKLDAIEFPVVFKICIFPAFRMENLEKVGYNNVWQYFIGRSAHNRNIYGWAGHTQQESVYSTVQEVKDMLFMKPEKIIHNINIKFSDRVSQKIYYKSKKYAKLERPNHPNNCLTIDLLKVVKNLTSIKQIQFNFHKSSKYQVELWMEDKKRSVSRAMKRNKFGISGPRLMIKNSSQSTFM